MKDKKVTSLILVLVLVIGIVASGTFAYWQWITSTAQETLVNVSLTDDATIYIDFPSEEITHMYPTSDCEANGTSSWVTDITVNNGTGVLMATNFKLKVKIEDKDGNVITNSTNEWNTNPFRYYIKYAVTEENESCQNALITGRFDNNVLTYGNVANTDPKYSQRNDWYDSKSITKDGSDGFPLVSSRIDSGVAFHAHPNTSTSHTYKVWVWLDEEYKSVTVGNDSTMDKMQDAKVTVSWSENSELEQVKQVTTPVGDAVAIYSADDNSLRFYRDEDPDSIEIGSTYNGRTVTEVYTDFEDSSDVPWDNKDFIYGTNKVLFEDYVYPISTASWFVGFDNPGLFDVTKLDVSNVTNMSYMFSFGENQGTIIGLENFNTSKVTNMSNMFGAVSNSVAYDLSSWNVCNVTNYDSFNTVFDSASRSYITGKIIQPNFGHPKLCKGDIKGQAYAVYSSDDNSLRFYRSETPIEVGSTYNGRVVTNVYTGFEHSYELMWSDIKFNVDLVSFETYIYPLSISYWFSSMVNLENLEVTKLITSSVTDMSGAFFEMVSLKSLDLSTFDTSNVTNMYNMFADMRSLEYLNLSSFDTSKVSNMSYMFNFSYNLLEIEGIENFDTSGVVNMEQMFLGTSSDLVLDLSNWNVCNVTSYYRFNYNGGTITEPNWGMVCPN